MLLLNYTASQHTTKIASPIYLIAEFKAKHEFSLIIGGPAAVQEGDDLQGGWAGHQAGPQLQPQPGGPGGRAPPSDLLQAVSQVAAS